MATFNVTCTERHAVHQRILSIGCTNIATGAEQRFSEAEAIGRIEAKTDNFVVRDRLGHQAVVEVELREGSKFLITRRDQVKTDNLAALPACITKPIVVPPIPPYRPVTPARSHSVRSEWDGWD